MSFTFSELEVQIANYEGEIAKALDDPYVAKSHIRSLYSTGFKMFDDIYEAVMDAKGALEGRLNRALELLDHGNGLATVQDVWDSYGRRGEITYIIGPRVVKGHCLDDEIVYFVRAYSDYPVKQLAERVFELEGF